MTTHVDATSPSSQSADRPPHVQMPLKISRDAAAVVEASAMQSKAAHVACCDLGDTVTRPRASQWTHRDIAVFRFCFQRRCHGCLDGGHREATSDSPSGAPRGARLWVSILCSCSGRLEWGSTPCFGCTYKCQITRIPFCLSFRVLHVVSASLSGGVLCPLARNSARAIEATVRHQVEVY